MNKKDEPLWCRLYREKVIRPKQRERQTEKTGRTLSSREGFYLTSEWKRIRDRRRLENPLCQECEKRGILKPMYVVDHIISIEEDPELALHLNNTQSLCVFCHNLKTIADTKRKNKLQRLRMGKKIMEDLENKF